MGKINISEPVKGEPLTVDKINTTIANWTTESTNINGENVHDQSLDHYNFKKHVVRSQIDGTKSGALFIRTNLTNSVTRQIYSIPSERTLNFLEEEHIFRGSFDVFCHMGHERTQFINHFFIDINIDFSFTFDAFLPNGSFIRGKAFGVASRDFRIRGNQILREHIHYSMSVASHLNNIIGSQSFITNDVRNLTVDLNFKMSHAGEEVFNEQNLRFGVMGHFAYIETIKR
jgi:hypothetical protein|tara:strand:+ start:779 stop:1468 length:690 start_codon:yes stop_codon:yes gene_type:complete